ncbi:MAG: 30S ribosomal protein S13 [Parcubacteria group bacterium ADurb.Bin305]|jgi:small subunit ribosomal protein S13|nr:30S ribosomal protein S13 [Candidatus Paceibacterota bacterium]MDD3434445.1 30S ribosomal protein S13 [Candidatus Paceibacterota bacterium]OQA44259.1 MAG: 30S ribosomal protein S13 [Parcubacteria group bacterium ADurb.Bin305]
MARFLNIDLPDRKPIWVSLTYLYGVGPTLAKRFLIEAKIDLNKKTKDVTPQEFATLKEIIEKQVLVENDLRREIRGNVKRLIDIGCYRGWRHAKHLPVRGQRTKSNSRTARGAGRKRKTVTSGRKKAASPT